MNFSIPLSLPTNSKFQDIELHPVKPWLITIEEDRSVYLWDYSLKSILLSLCLRDQEEKEGGNIKSCKFLDPHILRWKWLRSQDLSGGAFQGKGKVKYWIIIVMEYKLLFIDYQTSQKRSVSYNLFENKVISCVEVVDSSYMAIGFTDGSIRLLDLEDWEVVKVFPRGTHSKTITHLISYSKNLSQRSLLISVSGEGNIAVWNVDTCTDIPAFLIQSGSSSAHSGLINSISLNIETAQLFVIGSDNHMTIWNISNSTLVHRYKNLKFNKRKIVSGCFFTHPVLSQSTVLVHTGTNVISYFDTMMFTFSKESQNIHTLLELPSGKLINLKVHPLQPYLVFATCEDSIYPIYYERDLQQAFAWSDLFTSNIRPSGAGESHFLYYYSKDNLNSLIFSLPSETTAQSCQLLTRAVGGKVKMKVSPSGKYLSVLSSVSGLFDIYSVDLNPTRTPDRLKSGYSTHLVWDYSSDRFACICPLNEDDTPGSFASTSSKLLLVVYEVNLSKVCLIYRGDSMARPSKLFGGRVLGISSEPDHSTTFYSWESLKAVSSGIPCPVDVFWCELSCVISYKTEFFVYSYKEQLDFRYKICHSIRTGIWSYSVFFYSTDSEIFWLVPCIQSSFLFASHSIDRSEEDQFNIKEDQISAACYRKPHEYCSLAGIFQGSLVVVTSSYRVVSFEIKTCFLRFCLLVTSGIVNEAMVLSHKMQDNLHCFAAKVLVFMGFVESAVELTGLPYWKIVKIAVRHKLDVVLVRNI